MCERGSGAVYRCIDNIDNLRIRVRLREIFNSNDNDDDKEEDIEDIEEARVFSWQEKVHGKYEKSFYKDPINCVTDLEKKYHTEVLKIAAKALENDGYGGNEKLFSYVDEDGFLPQNQVTTSRNINANINLIKKMQNLNINQNHNKKEEDEEDLEDEQKENHQQHSTIQNEEYNFESSLQNSLLNPFIYNSQETMFILADFGEYFDETWLKNEVVLVELKYDENKKLLHIKPDFNVFESYEIKIIGDTQKTYEYFIENVSFFHNFSSLRSTKELQILNKINEYNKKLMFESMLNEFKLPKINVLQVLLTFEILSASNFEYENVYVQYFVDLPEGWKCNDQKSLRGFTQSCVICKNKNNEEGYAFFGFPFEIILEYDLEKFTENAILKPLYVYFEIISKDTWNRYRIEGLTYKSLPISQPGKYDYNLPCFRILSNNPCHNMRRFFIGDYGSHNDISWIGLPSDHKEKIVNKYGINTIGTGELKVRVNVLHQSRAFMDDGLQKGFDKSREKFLLDKLKSSKLIKSVEQVLQAFKRARQNMIEARKHVT